MKKFYKIFIFLVGIVLIFGIAGCNAGTNKLQSKIDSMQSQLEEMNNKLIEMEEHIQDLEDKIQDYVLKISADKQIYRSDEDIIIDITLENKSGEDVYFAYYSPWVVPDSSTGQFPEVEQSPEMTKGFFKNGEIIHLTDCLDGCFTVGKHSLKYKAVFYLGWETTDSVVEISSNTIDISIISIEAGTFYSLQECYDKGFLTQEDLQSIAKYRQNNNLLPPDSLSEEVSEAIKYDWVKQYKEENNVAEEITASIRKYYGTYNGYIAIIIDRKDALYMDLYAPVSIEVGGVTFTYSNDALPKIVIWSSKSIR